MDFELAPTRLGRRSGRSVILAAGSLALVGVVIVVGLATTSPAAPVAVVVPPSPGASLGLVGAEPRASPVASAVAVAIGDAPPPVRIPLSVHCLARPQPRCRQIAQTASDARRPPG